jgi:phosphoglycerate dehydrogenase-like enzyme
MKIAVLHGESPFAEAESEHLATRLSGHDVLHWRTGAPPPATDLQILLGVGSIDRAMLEAQPQLELVQTTSAGYEGVDLAAATELGIWVANAPSSETGNATSVAEWAVLLLLAASRDLGNPQTRVAQALAGKTVCVVGFGEMLVERLRPFGVHFVIVDEHPERAPGDADAFAPGDLKVAVTGADYIVLCIPATPDNEDLVDADVLAATKRGAILINVARGSLVDEPALVAALASGQIRAAGLDVLCHEPPSPEDPLVRSDHAFITPHIAGPTDVKIDGTARYVGNVLEDFTQGRRWPALLNDPPHPRRRLARSERLQSV